MNRSVISLSPFAALGMLLGFALVATSAQATVTCFTDWSDAAPIVVKERLVGLPAIQERTRRRQQGEIVRITLCLADQGYVYRVLLRNDDGRITSQTVDARGE